MTSQRCPGHEPFRKPERPFETNCPFCGTAMEIWQDERERKCPRCGAVVRKADVAAK